MKKMLSAPVREIEATASSGRKALPHIELRHRKGDVLHSSPLGADVLSLNLAMGCAHRCAYCSARAYSTYPGDEAIALFDDTAERLDEELAGRRRKPRAVYVSPSTDPFPPLAAVQAETARVVEVLARHGVEAWLMTRGFIRPSAMHVLAARREFVRVTIGMTTLERRLQRLLEPWAAPPRLRLKQIGQLRQRGIAPRIAVEPIVPGLTDTRENLAELLAGLAHAGVRHITAGYMFLRQGIRANLVESLAPLGCDQFVLEAFSGGPTLDGDAVAPARYLPKAKRQRGYAALMALAVDHGITVRVCDITNPDFRPPRPLDVGPRQLLLPMFAAVTR